MNEVSTSVFTPKHQDIKKEFLARGIHLMQSEHTVKNYQVAEDWSGHFESAEIETDDHKITVRIQMKRK
jgi:hypothetical protein